MKYKDYIRYNFPKDEFITLNNYKSIADFFYWPNIKRLHKSTLKGFIKKVTNKIPNEDSIVVVHETRLRKFLKLCADKPYKYIVVQYIIMGDENYSSLEIPNNVKVCFLKNVNFKSDKIISIPIGRDFRNFGNKFISIPIGRDFRNFKHIVDINNKDLNLKLLYNNFCLSTNKNRVKVFNTFFKSYYSSNIKYKKWNVYPIKSEDFFRGLIKHKFCLSPEGRGIDCFRTWDALYFKCIPIVQKSIHMESFKDLPILFTKDYSEITKEYLEEKYEEILETDYNIEKLKFKYWRNLINGFR